MKSLQRGFTLLKLMATVAILGMLASVVVFKFSEHQKEERSKSTQIDANSALAAPLAADR